jgi:hypothetical protein
MLPNDVGLRIQRVASLIQPYGMSPSWRSRTMARWTFS